MEEKERELDIDIKSDQITEMLSRPPKWFIRSGSGLFLIIILLLIGLAWLIEYPDEITGSVTVTTTKAPIELSNQSYIQLESLNVNENEKVNKGDILAQFDNQADLQDIKRADHYLKQLERLNGKFEIIPFYVEPIQLGTFQEEWSRLRGLISNWNAEQKQDVADKQIGSIKREIALREQLQAITENRISISVAEYGIIQNELASSERLAEQNAISKQVLAVDKRTHSQASQNVQIQKEQKVQNLIALNSLRNQLSQIEHDTWLFRQQKRTEIIVSISSLRNSLQSWEKNAVWIAPCTGKVLFNTMLQVNRFYKANEASIVIVPNGSGYTAVASIIASGAGKIKQGQKVFIELVDYPKHEFGMLEGKVNSITQIDKEGKYEVKINLPKQLKTTYGEKIAYKSQFKGTAKIITKNKRLLTRLFEQLSNLL